MTHICTHLCTCQLRFPFLLLKLQLGTIFIQCSLIFLEYRIFPDIWSHGKIFLCILPSLIFILSLAIIIICTFAALIYIPSPPPHSYAMCPKYWSPLRTVQKRKKKQKKKQGNKHFPPHSSCSYVMCPEYCVYRYFTFFYIPTSCWSSQSQYLHLDAKVKKKQDLDEMLETEVTTSFIQQNHQFTFQWQAAAIFKDKRSV